MLHVVVGSESAVKRRAAELALTALKLHYRIECVAAPSDVRPQPLDFAESYRGACMRARNALAMSESADLGLGIEQGILFPATSATHDVPALDGAVAVIANRRGHIVGVGTSACTPIPAWLNDRLRAGEEHGEIIRTITGTREKDATCFWTKGALARAEQLSHAVIAAFAPFMQEHTYRSAPSPMAARTRAS